MDNRDELYAVYACDQAKLQPLFDKIVKSLSSLKRTIDSETANAKRWHYETTAEINLFSAFILKNVRFVAVNG